MTTAYDLLISRLDAFIRKYYANQVIRGALVFLSCLLFYILTVTVGEYFLYMPVWARIGIVSVFGILASAALVMWVIVPLAKMAKLGKVISHEQAANIIGRHFPEISDRLLNILQLKRQTDNQASHDLVEASINQKIKQISVVPLTSAIDLSKNRKYLPYLLPLLLVGVFILVAAPNVFKEGSSRLLQPTKAFSKPAPFQFLIKNSSLTAIRNSDFEITMETKGNALPAEAYIEIGGEPVPMQPMANHTFKYTFKNVTDAVNFRFAAAGFFSDANTLKIIQRPILKSFKVQVNYPAYTGHKNEVRNSLSDMTLPAGTTVSWTFITDHTDAATIHFGSGAPIALPKNTATFAHQYRFMSDTNYTVTLFNKSAALADSYRYQVQVIPDQYPVIQLQQYRDTVSGKQILITGTAGDDYAITRASFNYEITDKDKTVARKSLPLKISPGALTPFQQYFDIQPLNLQPGQKVTYYVEAWDNDGVHGSKSSRSDMMSYQMYNPKQLDSAINANSKQINSGLSNTSQQTKDLQNDYKDAQSKMLQSNSMDWQQQQSLQEMMKKQMDLKAQMEAIKQRLEEQMQQSEQKKYSDDLKDKQKDLAKQMDNLLNEELKEQMKKLEELMKKLNKDQAVDAMKQLEQDNKLFAMDMERMQELMKKMEMDMRMEDMANKMDALAQKQRELQKATENGKKDAQTLSKEQKSLKDQLDKAMKEDMKQVQNLAKESKQNDKLEQESKQGDKASKDMEDSQESLDKKENDKAGKSQDDAAKNLEDMAKSLRQKSGGADADQIELDIRATRQILSNLIRLSFDQEDLMQSVVRTSPSSQQYIDNQEEQHRLYRNSQMIRDSMFVLSKRIAKLATTINKETTELEQFMFKSVEAMEARNRGNTLTNEQYVMTHTNNLALMLNELLSNLLQAQAEGKKQGSGSGSCAKPGKKPGKGSAPGTGQQLSDIITQQKQLGESMQKAQKPGGSKEGGGQGGQGKSGANGENGDAEQLARMAQQQASIRRKLQELTTLLNSKGIGASKEMRELEQKMDKNETDLVNRRLTSELMMRQKEITSRLLEVEKSMREQDQDDKRSSKTAQEPSRPVPPALEKYVTDQKQLLELYKTVPPQLKPYYKDMVENYFHLIGKEKAPDSPAAGTLQKKSAQAPKP
jgi:hypothetical protein